MGLCAWLPPTPRACARSGNFFGAPGVGKDRVAPRSPREGLPPTPARGMLNPSVDARPASDRTLFSGAVLPPVLRLAVVACLIVGCAGPSDPGPQVQERFRTAATPLLSAHDRLGDYARAVAEGDYARAQALWPEVAEEVAPVVEAGAPVAGELDPGQRATLVGYRGGLRAAFEAWEQVDAAIRTQQVGAVDTIEGRAAQARVSMRVLDDLRADAFGFPRAGLAPALPPGGAAPGGPDGEVVLGGVFQEEGDLEVHLVGPDLVVLHEDLLLLHPRTLDVAQRLGGSLEAPLDRVLEAGI